MEKITQYAQFRIRLPYGLATGPVNVQNRIIGVSKLLLPVSTDVLIKSITTDGYVTGNTTFTPQNQGSDAASGMINYFMSTTLLVNNDVYRLPAGKVESNLPPVLNPSTWDNSFLNIEASPVMKLNFNKFMPQIELNVLGNGLQLNQLGYSGWGTGDPAQMMEFHVLVEYIEV